MPVVLVTDYFFIFVLIFFPFLFFRLRVVVSSAFSVLGRRTRAGGQTAKHVAQRGGSVQAD